MLRRGAAALRDPQRQRQFEARLWIVERVSEELASAGDAVAHGLNVHV